MKNQLTQNLIARKLVSFIIPALNAEKTIRKIINNIKELGFNSQQIFIVDDGSKDKTYKITNEENVRVIKHRINEGKGKSIIDGAKISLSSGFLWGIFMDADLQHKISDIKNFIAFLPNAKIVIGTRNLSLMNMPFDRYLVNKITSLIISIVGGKNVHDVQSGYRLIWLPLFIKIPLNGRHFELEAEFIAKALQKNISIKELPIDTIYIKGNKSFINPLIDTLRFIKMTLKLLWI